MSAIHPSRLGLRCRDQDGLDELRDEGLALLIWSALGFAGYLMLFASDATRPETWLAPSALVSLGVLALRVRLSHSRVGACVFSTGLILLVVLEASVLPDGSANYLLYSPVILIAAITLGPVGGLAAALAATALIALAAWLPSRPPPPSIASTAVFLVWSSALLSWLAYRPLGTVLEWAWGSYSQALAKTQELEVRQGELARTLKTLNEAYEHLERLNDELAYARRAAEEARRLKAEFAASVSHELRTPLNVIIGFTETMVMSPESYGGQPLPVSYRADLDALYRNARHLSSLIDDILDLSQVEAGRMGLVKDRARLAPIVEEAIRVVAPLLEGKPLRLTVDVPAELPLVLIDRLRILQVLINLLGNAARFTDRGGVTVSARADAQGIVVSVADTGVGIAAEDLSRVFEEFRQLDGSTSRRHGGTGLGLAISKRFVELHGGSIWVESQAGRGSTFHFSLPLVDNVVAAPPAGDWQVWDRLQREQHPPQQALAVVCEDPTTARVLQRYLDGHQVLEAPSLAAVRDLVAKGRADGLIVAASSPRDSWAQLAEAEGLAGDLPIAVCSLPGRRELQRELGAAAYLVKPVDRTELLKAVAGAGQSPQSALVVDDDPEMVQMLGRMLRPSVRRVRYAYGGAEARALLAEWRPDVVLLDLLMPEVDGYAVLEWMRSDERLREVPVVVITARGAHEEVVRAGFVGISRPRGLSVGEMARYLKLGFER